MMTPSSAEPPLPEVQTAPAVAVELETTYPVPEQVPLTAEDLRTEARRWRGVARGASIAAAVLPLGGWWLGWKIGQPQVGLLLGGLAGGGAPGLLAAWALLLARRLDRQADVMSVNGQTNQ
jgi:hypothetical protein